jgi:lipid-A-disaccharide synthase
VSLTLFFSVGDPSGDVHTARLITELRRQSPELRCTGLGGRRMAQSGCELLYPLAEDPVLGILQPLQRLPFFLRLRHRVRRWLIENRPDAVVLVDYPGFNWGVARQASQLGIPVLYFLPPQVWAWATWRVRKIRRYVDHVLCAYPFEEAWYRARGVRAVYVGHPCFEELRQRILDEELVRRWQKGPGLTLGLLPGSRDREVELIGPVLLRAAGRVQRVYPETRIVAACYEESHRAMMERLARPLGVPVEIVVGKTPEVLAASTCCLAKSGSVSLELLWYGTPAVIFYRVPHLEYGLYRFGRATGIIQARHITLANLAADQSVFPELVSPGDASAALASAILEWLRDPVALAAIRRRILSLRQQFDRPGALQGTAHYILRVLGHRPLLRVAKSVAPCRIA